jgi:hypothetical protein
MSETLNLRAKAEAIKAARRAQATRLEEPIVKASYKPVNQETQASPLYQVVAEYVPAQPEPAYPELGYYADPSVYQQSFQQEYQPEEYQTAYSAYEEYPPFRPFEHTPKARIVWYIVISPVLIPKKVLLAVGRRFRRAF